MKQYNVVGKNVPRNDARDKVTGRGTFTHDVSMPGMLYAKVLRSPHAHAKILSIDTSAAEALPGVKAVATCYNTPNTVFTACAVMWLHTKEQSPDDYHPDERIFDDRVRYVGDEVAAVAATTEAIAEEACKLIRVEYEVLPAAFDPYEAMDPKMPLIHGELDPEQKNGHNVIPDSLVMMKPGDFQKGWEEGEVFGEAETVLGRQKQAQLETCAAVADYNKDGHLTVCCTTQTPQPVKMALAHVFGLPQSKVRVYNPPYVGGGFGVRIGMSGKAEAIAAALSKLAGKPVKLVYTREEDQSCTDSRHGGYVTFKVAAKKDGTMTAIYGRALLNSGSHSSYGTDVPTVLGCNTLSTYSVPNIDYEGRSVFTNTQSAGAMRGFGTPQGVFALEAAVDDLAKKLGMDPVELRLKNIRKSGEQWFIPYPCTSVAMDKCIKQAAEAIGWKEKHGKVQTGTIRRGVGIGIGSHGSNSYPSVDFSNVIMALEDDGSLTVRDCVPEFGAGASTALAQLAAECVGVPFEKVHFAFGDTETTLWDVGSHASRTLYTVGLGVLQAGNEVRGKILDYAGKYLNVAAEKLDIKEGVIFGDGKSIALSELAHIAHRDNVRFITAVNNRPSNAPPWHAHAVEVEVDMETGVVTVLKVAAAHDCGVAINPMIVEGQIEGGVMQGVGWGTREEILVNKGGRVINNSYHRYMVPSILDMPELESIIVECEDPTGPYGAKGVGECGMIPTAAAIAAAVEDAIGIRINEVPLTPARVLEKINEVYGKK